MSHTNDNTINSNPSKKSQDSNESFHIKRVRPRYITINEDIFHALSGDALKIYMALRYEADYSKDCSTVEKNIQFLCNTGKVTRTSCFESLNELEKNGLLIRRAQPGRQSLYLIATDLNYFNKKENIPVQDTDGSNDPSEIRTTPVRDTDTITSNLSNNKNYTHTQRSVEQNLYSEVEQQRKAMFFREECLNSEKCKTLYEKLPEDVRRDKTFEDIYLECLSHYATLRDPLLVSPQRLMSWIKRDINYSKKEAIQKTQVYKKPMTGTDKFNEMIRKEQKKYGVTYDHV